jgi:hypothetical protein
MSWSSEADTMRAPVPRAAWLVGFAGVAMAAAWAVFVRLPPMHVRIGLTEVDSTVPLGYQLSVFPAFGAFLGALALDGVQAREASRRAWVARALLVGLLALLSVVRLTGALPLSGHALFLFGVLGYEIAPPSDRDSAVLLTLVTPALLVVAWCKLVVWGDVGWFCGSAAVGSVLGAALARAARA